MMLCKNRPEGFGPKSQFSSNLPTTCFSDVIVVPLATWIYLVILIVAVPMMVMRSSRSRSTGTATMMESEKSGSMAATTSKSRSILSKTLRVIYYLLIVAMLAMVSLEIARLSIAELGIGLLPFTYVGVLAACALNVLSMSSSRRGVYGRGRLGSRWGVKVVNGLFWAMLLCAMAIKVAAEVKEENVAGKRVGVQADYPLSDSVTDNATMVGVEFVLLILEWLAF